jgi:hypothetical protein
MVKIGLRRAAVKMEPVELCPCHGTIVVGAPAVQQDNIPGMCHKGTALIFKEDFALPDIKEQKRMKTCAPHLVLRIADVTGCQAGTIEMIRGKLRGGVDVDPVPLQDAFFFSDQIFLGKLPHMISLSPVWFLYSAMIGYAYFTIGNASVQCFAV